MADEVSRAAARVLARIAEGEVLRVLVGDGRTEPASEIVLTAPWDAVLRSILTRGLTREIRGVLASEGDSPKLKGGADDDGVTGD